MSDFESITLALEPWFDKPLSFLPEELQQRLQLDFLPPWDDLSSEQRREAAIQIDYQHDPATASEWQYWWDFFWRRDALEEQISAWKKTTAATATDLATKEAKTNELRDELNRMNQQERQPQRPYIPGRTQSDSSAALAPATANYIAYPKALKILSERLYATPEELAAWIFLGTEQGGISAYTNANELDPPPRFFFGYYAGAEDYIAPLMACWFMEEDIASFQPSERFITGKALVERWGQHLGIQAEAFIRAKIAESRLLDIHPTFGGTRGTFSEKEYFPSVATGLFGMAYVTTIEAEDGIIPTTHPKDATETSEARKQRIKIRLRELKAGKVKNFLEIVASEEGISKSRIKQIVNDKPTPSPTTAITPDNPWAGLTASNRQPSQKKPKTQY